MGLDRATKLVLLLWLCLAIVVEAWLIPGGRGLQWAAASLLVGAGLSSALDQRVGAVVVASIYTIPIVLHAWYGVYHVAYDVVWMAALAGVMLPRALRTPWQFPPRWKSALVAWGYVVAISAVIVAAREVDFSRTLLMNGRMPWESFGGTVPRFNAGWVLEVAIFLVGGILWFDWLASLSDAEFSRYVIAPMALSAVLMMGAAVYQLFGDISWHNQNIYGGMGRASGTVNDANAMAVLAALWIGGFTVAALSLSGRWRLPIQALAVAVGWLAVWGSGSRTGLATALIVTGCVVFEVMRRDQHTTVDQPRRRGLWLFAAATAGAIALGMIGGVADGPLGRIAGLLARGSVADIARELWDRNGYGRHAVSMIQDHPWVGTGVGSYHLLVSDYASRAGDAATSDNAQNWYRHQWAEFGLIGSLPWIAWVFLFGGFVLQRHRAAHRGMVTLRGALLALALVSLVGMPGQLLPVALTFWTFAHWFIRLAGESPSAPPRPSREWAAIATLCLVFTAGTVITATRDLRPPLRAAAMGRDYSYGFHPPEPDGSGGAQYWTQARAVRLLDVSGTSIELTVQVNHADLDSNPVRAKVWLDRQLVIDDELSSPAPLVRRVSVTRGTAKVLLETWVNRTVWPPDLGVPDTRELGLLVSWRFVGGNEPKEH